MAKEKDLKKLREEPRKAGRKGLEAAEGFPIAPTKAMSRARKNSKRLDYPLPPYAANIFSMSRWVAAEWRGLGRWQSLAAPFIVIVALLTWEKEKAMQDDYLDELERRQLRNEAIHLYADRHAKKRKLLGIIPLPGR